MIQPTKWRTRILLLLAASLGVGSVVLFAFWPLGTLRIVRPQWSEVKLLAWDAALSALFFLQHSGMVRLRVRLRMATAIAPIYQPAIYASASGLALLAVDLLWQPSAIRIVTLTGPWRHVAHGFSVAALILFVWGIRSLRSFDPLGVVPLARHLRSKPSPPCPFTVSGAYRFVRHPLYLAVLVLLWSCPDVTADRLLLNGLWTAWMVVATLLEEADLVAELGDAYRCYRRAVPMLIPTRKPGAAGAGFAAR